MHTRANTSIGSLPKIRHVGGRRRQTGMAALQFEVMM